MPHPLDGPLRKVTRARDHLDALNRSVGAYLDDPHTIRVTEQLDRERDEMVWHMTIPVNPSWSFSLMAGDAIHNLRSALDLLAVQLVIANGGKRFVQRATSFPLYGSYSVSNTLRFWNAVLGMDTEAADIIDALQPYNGGQLPELLGLLSALDNAQKHRLIP